MVNAIHTAFECAGEEATGVAAPVPSGQAKASGVKKEEPTGAAAPLGPAGAQAEKVVVEAGRIYFLYR